MTINKDTVKQVTETLSQQVTRLQATLDALKSREQALDRKLTLIKAKRLKVEQRLSQATRKAEKAKAYEHYYAKQQVISLREE